MHAYLQLRTAEGVELVTLDADAVTLGKADSNDVVLKADRSVSRLHAVLERFRASWCIRDLDSRNGTYVNSERVLGGRPLRSGDQIRLGRTEIVYRIEDADRDDSVTEMGKAPPELTPREREVLIALCQPVISGDVFTEPASVRDLAGSLVVTEAAVKAHLLRLYGKFEIPEGPHRRARLANEAVRRGAIRLAELPDRRRIGPTDRLRR